MNRCDQSLPVVLLFMLLSLALGQSVVAAESNHEGESPAARNLAPEGWTALFNGKDIEGWVVKSGYATYVAEDGMITGTTAEGSGNTFLCTTKTYKDFELVFDVFLHDKKLNSGVQVRSRVMKENPYGGRIGGPQVEITSGRHGGYIFGEAGLGGWWSTERKEKLHDHFVNGQWNRYRVVAKGNRIKTFINGHAVTDTPYPEKYKDDFQEGVIGLQVHGVKGDQKYRVSWRNIYIRELNDQTDAAASRTHGLVGLRPLPRDERDHKSNHGGSWAGTPTYQEQAGRYPFVAEHIDTVKGWLDGDFKTKRLFLEYYWGLSEERDDLDPEKNLLVRVLRRYEQQGATIGHILICREYRLAIHRGHEEAKPGPFEEDTRILYEQDVDSIRAMFRRAHEQGLLKQADYSLIQMVEHPSFFADDERVKPIIDKMEGVCLEVHQFNRHWPLEEGWVQPEPVVRGAKWTLNQGKEYIFYYGPIIYKSEHYVPFIERDWLKRYWAAGLPKHHPRMHYYLNTFPHLSARRRPVGPETDPHSTLGFAKWLIKEIKDVPEPDDD
ncbi:MAG: 3-keto-disaccharide hydrolase [Phycisphaeraceae bacterium]